LKNKTHILNSPFSAINSPNAFFRAGEIESWGRGIQRIFEACQQGGAPDPVLRLSGHDLWTEFPYSPDYLEAIGEGSVETTVKTSVKKRINKLDEQLHEKLDEKLGKNRAKIIRRLRQNPKMTVIALSQHLEISRNAVYNNIKILNETGWIQRIGPAKGGHWEVLK